MTLDSASLKLKELCDVGGSKQPLIKYRGAIQVLTASIVRAQRVKYLIQLILLLSSKCNSFTRGRDRVKTRTKAIKVFNS